MNAADLLIEGAVEHLSSCHSQQMCEILQDGRTASNTTASAELPKRCSGYKNLPNPRQWQIRSYSNVHPLLKLA